MSKKHIIGDDVFIVRHEADDVLPGERPLQWQRYDAFNSIEEAVSGAAECLVERFLDRGDHCGSVQIVGYPSMTQCDIRWPPSSWASRRPSPPWLRFLDRGDHCGSVQIVGYPSMTQCDIRDIQDILIKFWRGLGGES